MQTDLSIGAIGAAIIAGVISLIGLIISKEQKISDFRQEWLNSLRSEITLYLTSINAVSDALKINYTSMEYKVKAISPLISKLNEANFLIILRINPEEEIPKKLIACMKEFELLASTESDMTPEKIRPIEYSFLRESQKLLKSEWTRVKKGELTFRISKIIILIFVILSIICLAINLTTSHPSAPESVPKIRILEQSKFS